MKGEEISYLRGMCISFTIYPTKPMIRTVREGQHVWLQVARSNSVCGFEAGNLPV